MKVIYKIINVVNNKFYVGSATKFNRRKWAHISQLRAGCHANNYLQKAWDKYGEKSFVFVVVEEVSETENILEVENKWLKENVGKDFCYNIALDATAPTLGMTGEKATWRWGKNFPHKQDSKDKIGKSSKGRPQSEETRAKRIATMTGVTHTLERRMNLSRAVSGDKNPNYGKPKSQEFKEKVSRKVTMVSPDGEAVNYPSILALREATGLKPSTVNNGLKHGNPMRSGPYKGWRFENA